MEKIYIVKAHTESSPGHELEADIVKLINPDRIICWCTQELEFEYIFGKFFDKLETWLEAENKYINLITPHLDQIYVRPRVIVENSCGYIFDYMYSVLRSGNYHQQMLSVSPFLLNNNFTKLYSCYINRCDYNRGNLIDHLAKENLLEHGIVTFRYPEKYPFWKWHDGSRLCDEEDFTLHENYSPTEFPKSFFNCFLDLVVESRYLKDEFFITEKTLKSIIAFKPFIVLSCAGFHKKYLRDYFKFELYDEIFDYSFDELEDPTDRINAIIDNIKKLTHLNNNELLKLYHTLIPKLQRNKFRLFEIMFNKDLIIPKSGRFFIDGTNYELHSKFPPHEMRWAEFLGWSK